MRVEVEGFNPNTKIALFIFNLRNSFYDRHKAYLYGAI